MVEDQDTRIKYDVKNKLLGALDYWSVQITDITEDLYPTSMYKLRWSA